VGVLVHAVLDQVTLCPLGVVIYSVEDGKVKVKFTSLVLIGDLAYRISSPGLMVTGMLVTASMLFQDVPHDRPLLVLLPVAGLM
jgi:hypothetical protein